MGRGVEVSVELKLSAKYCMTLELQRGGEERQGTGSEDLAQDKGTLSRRKKMFNFLTYCS